SCARTASSNRRFTLPISIRAMPPPSVPGRTVPDLLLQRLVHLLDGEQDRGLDADHPARVDRERQRRRRDVVRQLGDADRIGVTERVVERLQTAALLLEQCLEIGASLAGALLDETLRAFGLVGSLEEILGHRAPPCRMVAERPLA